MREYRCTRNALYQHDCTGRHDLRERQGHYIMARNEEEAWQKMAIRYPEEVRAGFTVHEWQGGDVQVIEIKRDKDGNIIEE
ncbi:hypothetical protein NIES4071_107710 (plasmid) [Calothrix sp. NIES-4071]|nr:hypothetical protein NIES4071_107710 [Calothrix sp. NIES-4071]BAZ64811.1 hypothetical protein NIES4105_105440 [Calothrix sp. NIES-4105]